MEPSRRPPPIRPARLDELEALLDLQQSSLRQLAAADYPREILEAALAHLGTMDPRMIADGTYLVAERDGVLLGCAGWTTRPLPYARLLRGALAPLPAACGRAGAVRSLYVAPAAARQGVGSALLARAEAGLLAAGLAAAELLVAISGEAFFRARGYATLSGHAFALAEGMDFTVARMMRPLAARPALPVTRAPAAAAAAAAG